MSVVIVGSLIYLRARYYDPSSGQFLSSDPIERLTRERYPYVQDNPLNRRDPSGLCQQSGGPNVGLCSLGLTIAAVGVVGGVALLASGVGEFVAAASPEIPFIESIGGWIASVSGAKMGLAVVGAGIAGATGLVTQNCPPLIVDAS